MNPYKEVKFEHLGYAVDYHIGERFIGSKKIEKKDRKTIGYSGRITKVAEEDIFFKTGKVIKNGTKYDTYLYPLCGKSNINISIKY